MAIVKGNDIPLFSSEEPSLEEVGFKEGISAVQKSFSKRGLFFVLVLLSKEIGIGMHFLEKIARGSVRKVLNGVFKLYFR